MAPKKLTDLDGLMAALQKAFQCVLLATSILMHLMQRSCTLKLVRSSRYMSISSIFVLESLS
jgi:hypothetical protein